MLKIAGLPILNTNRSRYRQKLKILSLSLFLTLRSLKKNATTQPLEVEMIFRVNTTTGFIERTK